MKTKPNVVLTLLESLFYAACAAVVVSGSVDTWLRFVPYLAYALGLIALSLLITTILTINRSLSFSSRFRAMLGVSLLAIAAMHLSSQPAVSSGAMHPYPASPLFFLYYGIIITYAVAGKALPLLIVMALCIGGETANCFVLGYFQGIFDVNDPLWPQSVLTRRVKPLFSFGYMLCAGFVPYFITVLKNQNGNQPHAQQKVPLRQFEEGKSVQAAAGPAPYHSGKTSLLVRQDSEDPLVEEADLGDILSSVVYFMSRNFKAYSALGFIYDPVSQAFALNSFHSKSLSIIKDMQIPLGRGVVGKIGVDKKSFISGDLSNYSAEVLYYSGISPVKSIVASPIISEAKELLGALVIDSQDPHAFKDEHQEIMRRFSHLAAALITNVRMRLYQERAAQHFQIFYEASQQFITALHLDQVFDVLVAMAQQIAVHTRIMALTAGEHNDACTVVKIRGPSPEISEGFCFGPNTGLYSYALQKRKIVNVPDFQQFQGKYYRMAPDETANESIRSLIIIPIMGEENRPLGLFSVESDEPSQFLGEMETVLFTLVSNASVAITRARLYHQMEMLAITDGLTHLLNHKHFQTQLGKEIERSRRYTRPLSLLIMDIDYFKSFNDTYGHPVGDLVLREIAKCIMEAIRVNDIAARYGGEEFAVIIPETNEQRALATAERIRTKIEQRVLESGNNLLHVTISIGCALYPDHAATQQELIENADKALYFSKENGRNLSSLYTKEMAASH
jgi:diguanylate cyclase (GGDEF)-like protein